MCLYLVHFQLKKENPKLGKAAKVVVVGLDDVYDLITYPSQIFGIEVRLTDLYIHVSEIARVKGHTMG